MNQNTITSAVAAAIVAILVGIFAVHVALPAPQQAPDPGAVTSPDISSRYLQWGGVTEWRTGVATAASSSVFCSIQPPAATSTIVAAYFRVDATGLGTQTFDIATSSTNVGTSSPALVAAATVPGAQGVINWQPGVFGTSSASVASVLQPSNATGATVYVITPVQYLNFRVATGTPGTFASYISGKCGARFITL